MSKLSSEVQTENKKPPCKIELQETPQVQQIYQMPPKRLIASGDFNLLNIIANELKRYLEINDLLKNRSTTIQEVAGFVIVITDRANHLFKKMLEKMPSNKVPFTLKAQLNGIDEQINKIGKKGLNLFDELYYIIAEIRDYLDNIKNSLIRNSENIPDFDKKLLCDDFIDKLSHCLLNAKEWCGLQHANESENRITQRYLKCF